MGTRYAVKYLAGRGGPAPDKLSRRVEDRLNQLVARMSPYRPDSELARLL